MKKALGLLAIVGGAAAIVAYKMLKDEKVKVVNNEEDVEKHIIELEEEEEAEEEEEQSPSYETATYPYLNNEDMIAINNICENTFETLDLEALKGEEKPVKHCLHFENKLLMEKFKSIVIEEGYVVTSGEDESELVVLHVSEIDVDLLLSKVFYLANVAKDCFGEYKELIIK